MDVGCDSRISSGVNPRIRFSVHGVTPSHALTSSPVTKYSILAIRATLTIRRQRPEIANDIHDNHFQSQRETLPCKPRKH
jgi:carbamoylphosphate synthase large subunit